MAAELEAMAAAAAAATTTTTAAAAAATTATVENKEKAATTATEVELEKHKVLYFSQTKNMFLAKPNVSIHAGSESRH